jgi:hypothetical protein
MKSKVLAALASPDKEMITSAKIGCCLPGGSRLIASNRHRRPCAPHNHASKRTRANRTSPVATFTATNHLSAACIAGSSFRHSRPDTQFVDDCRDSGEMSAALHEHLSRIKRLYLPAQRENAVPAGLDDYAAGSRTIEVAEKAEYLALQFFINCRDCHDGIARGGLQSVSRLRQP